MILPEGNCTYEGRPIEVLESLIDKRRELLGEAYRDAITATAITVLKSLRADTKIAPKKARKTSYTVTDTGWYGGWERVGGKFHRVVRAGGAAHCPKVPGVFPVNNAGKHYEKGEVVKVYKIEPVKDETMSWNKTKHKGCWYVFAKSEKVARAFAERHMTSRILSYRGLARATLGFAMAAISNSGNFAADVKTAKSKAAAAAAAQVYKDVSDDTYTIRIVDALNYSALALKSGTSGVDRAVKKAANSIAGRLSKVAAAKLDAKIPTPFPEVKG